MNDAGADVGPANIDSSGGMCEYRETEGTCVITSAPGNIDPDACPPEMVTIRFDFIPDGQTTALLDDVQATIRAKGLTLSSTHPCIRSEITRGTCTPTIWRFSADDC